MRVGDEVPDFTAVDDSGESVTLSALLADGPVVLFFYPAALTPGCTRESCHFRDLAAEFGATGARVVGISADPVEKQTQFRDRYNLGFPLLSDPERRVAGLFGVRRPGRLPNRRTTFVIGGDGQVLARVASEVSFARHADEALATLTQAAGRA